MAFTNLGHAYYEKGNDSCRRTRMPRPSTLPRRSRTCRSPSRTPGPFRTVHYDEAVHDTYYYTAISYHKLYLVTKKGAILNSADLA